MKKIKLLIMSVAILSSFAAAYASRPKVWSPQEYYWNGAGYVMVAGTYGLGYACQGGTSSNCTFIQDMNGNFVLYRTGQYVVIPQGVNTNIKK